ncbi:hypothetical protein ABPG72_007466 [Tetrahymena utriculariae]
MGNNCCVPNQNNGPSQIGYSFLNKNNQDLTKTANQNNPNFLAPPDQNQQGTKVSQLSSLRSLSSQQNKAHQEKHPFDDYQKLANLGSGAYGEVSLVRKKKDGKLYAMKVVKKEKVALNRKMVEATLLEQKILKKSKHPFIVKLSQSFQTEGKLYIIMEYMANGDLYSVLQKVKRFDENTARFIFAEVILGLQYLHEEQNTMYRDLKPENILIGEDCHIKLSDFGLAKQFVNKEDKENAFLGTPQYLAPEIVLQKPYDKNIDLWTLGILLFELLSGKPPFGSGKNLMKDIIINKPAFPSYFSANAVDLIKKLLQNIGSKRLGSNNFAELKSHPFFEKIDWDKIFRKELESLLKQYISKKPDRAYREKTIIESPRAANKKPMYNFPEFTYNPNSLLIGDDLEKN